MTELRKKGAVSMTKTHCTIDGYVGTHSEKDIATFNECLRILQSTSMNQLRGIEVIIIKMEFTLEVVTR